MNRREAEELLPWYVAGALSLEESKAVRAFIEAGEIDAADLNELALLNETVAEVAAEEPAFNQALLRNVLDRLDEVPQDAPDEPLVVLGESGIRAPDKTTTSSDGSEGLLGYLKRWLDEMQWSLTPPLAKVAIGAQFVLVLGLVVALTLGDGTESVDPGGYEVVSGTTAGDITLVFAPGAGEAEIRALLLENRVRIVAGPSALGVYTLALDKRETKATVVSALDDSPLTVFVQAVPER